MERLEIHWSKSFLFTMVGLGLISCGFVPLIMWLVTARHYPKAIDSQGVTMGNGQVLPWSALTQKKRTVLEGSSGRRTVVGVALHFGKTVVQIAPSSFAEGYAVLDFISRILGEDLTAVTEGDR